MSFTKSNKTFKSTANDRVYTPTLAAKYIVEYFAPTGRMLEPCCGDGAFLKYLPNADWCEIEKGKDFFDYHERTDWIITNPPFSIYDKFLLHSFAVADNVVFLTQLNKTIKSKKLDIQIQKYGELKEVVLMGGGNDFGFPFGFPCGCLYYKRGYFGATRLVRAYDWKEQNTISLLGSESQ